MSKINEPSRAKVDLTTTHVHRDSFYVSETVDERTIGQMIDDRLREDGSVVEINVKLSYAQP